VSDDVARYLVGVEKRAGMRRGNESNLSHSGSRKSIRWRQAYFPSFNYENGASTSSMDFLQSPFGWARSSLC